MEYTVEYMAEQRALYAYMPNIMGTRLEIIIFDTPQAKATILWEEIVGRLKGWHALLNRFDEQSEVGQINCMDDTDEHRISKELEQIVCKCREYWQKTEHLFDITKQDMSLLEVADGIIRKRDCQIKLDLGGFAKGYALERIREILRGAEIDRAIVNFGHSTIMAINGDQDDQGWVIALPSPYDGREVAQFTLKNCTLSISGNTPSYSGHIVNPTNGEAICDRVLCSVIADNPLDAEVLSTSLLIADTEQRERIVERFENVIAKRYNL